MKKKPIIHIINPNSSESVTSGLARELAGPSKLLNVTIDYMQIDKAPPAIESAEDVAIAHQLVTELVSKSQADAYVIACFCDPGVQDLKSHGYNNVFGIGECAMHMASLLGKKFGILSILDASVERHKEQVKRAGLTTRLAADLALNLGVLELENEGVAWPRIEQVGRTLVDKYESQALILGCAGMGRHKAKLQNLLKVPVIDPCWAGLAIAASSLGILKV